MRRMTVLRCIDTIWRAKTEGGPEGLFKIGLMRAAKADIDIGTIAGSREWPALDAQSLANLRSAQRPHWSQKADHVGEKLPPSLLAGPLQLWTNSTAI
jgi:hypothetical protein